MAFLVLGPSGSGKSTLAKQYYPGHLSAVDIDVFGIRVKDPDKSSGWRWVVHPSSLSIPTAMQRGLIAFGIMDNWAEIIRLPWRKIFLLYGDPKLIAERGAARDKKRDVKYRKTYDEYLGAAIEWNAVTVNSILQNMNGAPVMLKWDSRPGRIARQISDEAFNTRRSKSRRQDLFTSVDEALNTFDKYTAKALMNKA